MRWFRSLMLLVAPLALAVLSQPLFAQGLNARSLRDKQESQQRAREMARELVFQHSRCAACSSSRRTA